MRVVWSPPWAATATLKTRPRSPVRARFKCPSFHSGVGRRALNFHFLTERRAVVRAECFSLSPTKVPRGPSSRPSVALQADLSASCTFARRRAISSIRFDGGPETFAVCADEAECVETEQSPGKVRRARPVLLRKLACSGLRPASHHLQNGHIHCIEAGPFHRVRAAGHRCQRRRVSLAVGDPLRPADGHCTRGTVGE